MKNFVFFFLTFYTFHIRRGTNLEENSFHVNKTSPEQIQLSFTGNVTSMFVTWVSQNDVSNASVLFRVELSDSPFYQSHAVKTPLVHTEKSSNKTRTTFIFRAILTNLTPNTSYEYLVKHGNSSQSKMFTFKTFDDSKKFKPRLCLYGDVGVNQNASLPKLINKTKRGDFDFVIQNGDIAYNLEHQLGKKGDRFGRMIQPISARVPYNMVPGNHENYGNFSEFVGRYTSPGPNVFYNSFNVGPIHIVVFTTSFYLFDKYGTGQIQAQYNWLKQDLQMANEKSNRKKHPWIIAVGHRPMYCSNFESKDCLVESVVRTGYNNSDFNLEKLFFDFGVDVQVYGHKHDYERLYPVFNYTYQKTPNISVYSDPIYPVHLITGSAGLQISDQGFTEQQPDWSAVRSRKHGFTVLSVLDRLKLQLEQVAGKEDELIDSFLVTKSKYWPPFYQFSKTKKLSGTRG